MSRGRTTGRLKQLVPGGTLAALRALGAAVARMAAAPGQQVSAVAGDLSQGGLGGPTTTRDPQTALNFTKSEYKTTARNFATIEF